MKRFLQTFSLVFLLAIIPLIGEGQRAEGTDPRRIYATRATLLEQAEAAERDAAASSGMSDRAKETRRGEAWVLRQRLENGDFLVGDRIVLTVYADSSMSDTLTVLTNRVVQVRGVPALSLAGVLRSELEEHLTSELGKYLRNPRLDAVPLVRVAISGEVARPGFYNVRADLLLADAVMLAGGPTREADLDRSELRRGAEVLFRKKDVSVALSGGVSLDELHLRGGDELFVGARRRMSMTQTLQGLAAVAGLTSLVLSLSR